MYGHDDEQQQQQFKQQLGITQQTTSIKLKQQGQVVTTKKNELGL